MSAESNAHKVVMKIVQAAHTLVAAERITVYTVDESSSDGVSLVAEFTNDSRLLGRRFPVGSGVPGHVALTGRTLNITDAQRDWRVDDEYFNPRPPKTPPSPRSMRNSASRSPSPDARTARRRDSIQGRVLVPQTILAIPIKDFLGKNIAVLEAVCSFRFPLP